MPSGAGEIKPNHYRDMLKVVWRNRDQLPFAWRILREGVCDGCALGTTGLRDFTMEGIHLCMTRLNLLRLNTMAELDVSCLENIDSLSGLSGSELRELGRLPYPMMRKRGEPGFRRVGWEEVYGVISDRIRSIDPRRGQCLSKLSCWMALCQTHSNARPPTDKKLLSGGPRSGPGSRGLWVLPVPPETPPD